MFEKFIFKFASGQQLLSDTKQSKQPDTDEADDLTEKIFKKAQEQGAQSVGPETVQKKPSFSGSGQRLGSLPSQNQQQQQQQNIQQQNRQPQGEPKKVTITFYLEGFTVNDGELRRYDEPRNKEFLRDIDNGVMPAEVEGIGFGQPVEVTLLNKKTENYVPPPKVFKPFEGGGRSLSSSSSASTFVPPPTTGKAFSYKVDESKPVTTLRITLHDGTKLTAKFNLSDKISVVEQFVRHAKPINRPFSLMMFPKKVLDNPDLTLEEAGLKNATIVQNLV